MNWRYAGWLVWSNFITLLATLQTIVATLLLNEDSFNKHTFRIFVIANAVLTGVVAQIKRNKPPGPPPTREPDNA